MFLFCFVFVGRHVYLFRNSSKETLCKILRNWEKDFGVNLFKFNPIPNRRQRNEEKVCHEFERLGFARSNLWMQFDEGRSDFTKRVEVSLHPRSLRPECAKTGHRETAASLSSFKETLLLSDDETNNRRNCSLKKLLSCICACGFLGPPTTRVFFYGATKLLGSMLLFSCRQRCHSFVLRKILLDASFWVCKKGVVSI